MHLLRLHGHANAETAPPITRTGSAPSTTQIFRILQENLFDALTPPLSMWGLFYWCIHTQGEAHG